MHHLTKLGDGTTGQDDALVMCTGDQHLCAGICRLQQKASNKVTCRGLVEFLRELEVGHLDRRLCWMGMFAKTSRARQLPGGLMNRCMRGVYSGTGKVA